MKIVVKKNPAVAQPYYFVIKANNGETIAQSECYSRKIDARNTIATLVNGIKLATVHDSTGEDPDEPIDDETDDSP